MDTRKSIYMKGCLGRQVGEQSGRWVGGKEMVSEEVKYVVRR